MPLSLRDIACQYVSDLRTRAQPRTVEESARILDRVLAELGVETIDQLTRPRVHAWRLARVAGGSSNKTVNNALAVLLAALGLCVQLGQLETVPLVGLRSLPVGPRHQRRRPRALSEWEIARLVIAADEIDREADVHASAERTIAGGSKGRRYAARGRPRRIPQAMLVRALIETGARWGELTAAVWADLDEPAGLLTLRAENTKTQVARAVPLRGELVDALRLYRRACVNDSVNIPRASDVIFLAPHGKPWGRGTSNFRRFLGLAYERAGLLERDAHGRLRSSDGCALNVHTLRHTCCTRLARAGAPLPIAQAVLGHASASTTARVYSHFRAEAARVYLESLKWYLPSGSNDEADSGGAPMAPAVEAARSRPETSPAPQEKASNARLSGS